jgi:F420-dependent oxidoreductase-like protein
MDVSLQCEATVGLNWENWPPLLRAVEEAGFAALFRCDHFVLPQPPDNDALDLIVSLVYAADHTSRIRLGSLVAPVSFRDPHLLARQAAAIDDLSGGRFVLGVGAGWNEREHAMFGYHLGDKSTRLDRFEEGLAVISALLRSEPPVSFEGKYFQLRDAVMTPRPKRPGGPRILVGGSGPKRTLPLAARYADIWNGNGLTPEEFVKRNAILDKALEREGRDPGEVQRTLMLMAVCYRNESEMRNAIAWFTPESELRTQTPREIIEARRNRSAAFIAGSPEQVAERLREYADVGVAEVMLQWGVDNLDGLRLLGEEVIPHVTRG